MVTVLAQKRASWPISPCVLSCRWCHRQSCPRPRQSCPRPRHASCAGFTFTPVCVCVWAQVRDPGAAVASLPKLLDKPEAVGPGPRCWDDPVHRPGRTWKHSGSKARSGVWVYGEGAGGLERQGTVGLLVLHWLRYQGLHQRQPLQTITPGLFSASLSPTVVPHLFLPSCSLCLCPSPGWGRWWMHRQFRVRSPPSPVPISPPLPSPPPSPSHSPS